MCPVHTGMTIYNLLHTYCWWVFCTFLLVNSRGFNCCFRFYILWCKIWNKNYVWSLNVCSFCYKIFKRHISELQGCHLSLLIARSYILKQWQWIKRAEKYLQSIMLVNCIYKSATNKKEIVQLNKILHINVKMSYTFMAHFVFMWLVVINSPIIAGVLAAVAAKPIQKLNDLQFNREKMEGRGESGNGKTKLQASEQSHAKTNNQHSRKKTH